MNAKELALALIFSIIIISGSSQAVFGQLSTQIAGTNTIIPDPFVDVINPGPSNTVCTTGALSFPHSQSFIPNADNLDAIEVELVSLNLVSVSPVTINVYDGAGTGGLLLGSTSNDDGNFGTPDGGKRVSPVNSGVVRFEFAPIIPLIPGNTYTAEVTVNDGASDFNWSATDDNIPGNIEGCVNGPLSIFDYVFATYFDPNFVVGGESLSIDSTALILAGAQSFSWMIPLVLSGIGIGLFVVSRKSENS